MALDFSHVVIGGGAIGLAIASRLAAPTVASTTRNVLLLDRNRHVGQETSSRNSEVIHAGIYYPKNSLKTELCIKGRQMLYELFDKEHIGYQRCGKWIIAQNEQDREYLQVEFLCMALDQLLIASRNSMRSARRLACRLDSSTRTRQIRLSP